MKRVTLTKVIMMSLAACVVAGCGGAGAEAPSNPTPAPATTGSGAAPGAMNANTSPAAVDAAKDTAKAQAPNNQFWWPEHLDLAPLRQQGAESNPLDADFKYGEAFKKLDLKAVKKDIAQILTTSQAWWPADYGSYAPFFIRMAWHSAGTYRISDGRGGAGGGQQRFEPLNSWPDNANLDKARRLLWPIKMKYGKSLSWADLMVLTGNVSLESMGFKTFGFAGGRRDQWEADMVYWGPEHKFMGDERHTPDGKLQKPLGAVQMGLIYVNPEGPERGKPDPSRLCARHPRSIRSDGDERRRNRRVDRGRTQLRQSARRGGSDEMRRRSARRPRRWKRKEWVGATRVERAWARTRSRAASKARGPRRRRTSRSTTSRISTSTSGSRRRAPRARRNGFRKMVRARALVPDAHDPTKTHPPIMFTTDLALKFDPAYQQITQRFLQNPKDFELAFAKAWFKLTHRDMGPRSRYIGIEVPQEELSWQDPIPAVNFKLVGDADDQGPEEEDPRVGPHEW